MSQFQQRVLYIISQVPHAKVVSYGQVAALAGIPRAARQVGYILARNEGNPQLPWWRVVNNQGYITIKGNHYNSANLQQQLLEGEGIEFIQDYHLDIEKYRYRPEK